MTSSEALAGREYSIHGRVQGVGFRWFTQETAVELGLVGSVCNLENGTVQARAYGSTAKLDVFEQQLRNGPPSAEVTDVRSRSIEQGSAPTEFEIVR